jgi:branched-chain amino acid transport system substrate-binding protein
MTAPVRRPRRFPLLAWLAALALVLAACGDDDGDGGAGGEEGPIRIGVPVPLSGENAPAGEDILNGANLAAEHINADGGVLGRDIEIVSEDDACSAQVGSQAAEALIAAEVAAVAGGYCSTASLPELQAFSRAGIPFVMDASTNAELTEMGLAEAFRVIGRDDQQGPFAAQYIAEELGAARAAVLHDNTTYSEGLAAEVVGGLEEQGVEVVYHDALTPGQSDYTPVLTSIAGAEPDVLYYSGYFAEAGLLIGQAEQLGVDFQLMGGDATNDPTIVETAGEAAEGFLFTTAPLAQFLEGAAEYLDAYEEAHGQAPGPYSVYEYEAVHVVAQAIEDAGSAEPEAITEALAALEGYEGITGTITFDDNGDRDELLYIVATVTDGEFVAHQRLEDGEWVDAG